MGYIHVVDERLHNAVAKTPKLGGFYFLRVTAVGKNSGKRGGQEWTRTTDTGFFSPLAYHSYPHETEYKPSILTLRLNIRHNRPPVSNGGNQ